MTPTETTSKRLSGGARGLLNDLILLNEKTTAEMARGVAESYLDRDGAVALAEKLGVEPPRVKRRFYRYFTITQVYSLSIDAYTPEEADREAARMQEINVGHEDMHYGNRSRFNMDEGRMRQVFSTVSAQRPTVSEIPNIHPWELERAEAEANNQARVRFTGRMNWSTVIGT